MCPKAYEPHTVDDRPSRRTFALSTFVMSGEMAGYFDVKVGEGQAKFKADARQFSASECREVVEKMGSVSKATCDLDNVDEETGTGTYTVTILEYPKNPYENNLFSHSGNIPSSAITCNTTSVSQASANSPSCVITDIVGGDEYLGNDEDGNDKSVLQELGLPLYLECGGHGSCRENGTCHCALGYYGDTCSSTEDNGDIDAIISTGPFFTGNVLKLEAQRQLSPDFNLFKASVLPSQVSNEFFKNKLGQASLGNAIDYTVIRGDGEFIHNGGHTVNGAATVSSCTRQDCSLPHEGIGPSAMTVLQLPVTGDSDATTISSITYGDGNYHFRAYNADNSEVNPKEVFSVTSQGGLFAASGSLVADEGLVTTTNAKVAGSLDVSGPVTIADSLTLGSEFTLTPGGMTVSVERHSGTLLELRSGQEDFVGSLLELHSVDNSSVMLSAVVDGVTTFELQSSGDIVCQSLVMRSGGVEVESGGVNIVSGGLKVESGGISIISGGLNLGNADVEAAVIKSSSDALEGSLFSAHARNTAFSGTLFTMEASPASDPSTFDFMDALGKSGNTAFRVSGNGKVTASGGLVTGSGSPLSAHGPVSLNDAMAMTPHRVSAGATIKIPSSASFIIIENDGIAAANEIKFEVEADGRSVYAEGSVIILQNMDFHDTVSPFVPSMATAFFVYSGGDLHEISSSKTSQREFKGVEAFELSADVDAGNHTFSVGRLAVKNIDEGRVPVVGISGILSSFPMFTYTKGVLSTPAIKANKLLSDVDARGHTISNAELSQCSITDASVTAKKITLPDLAGSVSTLAMLDENGKLGRLGTEQPLKVESMEAIKIVADDAVITDVSAKSASLDTLSSGDTKLGKTSILGLTVTGLSHTDVTGYANIVANVDGMLELRRPDPVSEDDGAQLSKLTCKDADIDSITTSGIQTERITSKESTFVKLASDDAVAKKLTADVAVVTKLTAEEIVAKKLSMDKIAIEKLTSDDATLKKLTSDDATLKKLTSDDATLKKLTTDEANAKVFLGDDAQFDTLTTGQAEIKSIKADVAEMGSLATSSMMCDDVKVKSLAGDKLEAGVMTSSKATVDNLRVTGETTMGSITVAGATSINADAHVGGTLTVHGAVMGSGPYIDSSDRRFKRNIEPIDNALALIANVTAYRYFYRSEDFPDRNFPREEQIGWIAQEVAESMPELVSSDEEDFNHVAYARATSIVASAVNELRREVAALHEEVVATKAKLKEVATPVSVDALRSELMTIVADLKKENEILRETLQSLQKHTL